MAEFKHDPRNARRHTPRNKELIRQSLKEVGAGRSILVDGEGIVRAGNGVYEEAQAMGLKVRAVEAAPDELIAVVRPDLTGEKAERAALFDNRTAELSEWDTDVLALLKADQPDVIDGIFDGGDLEAMLDEAEDLDAVAEEMQREGDEESSKVADRLGDEKAKIRPVLYVGQVGIFEQALRSTGLENRGEALVAVCRFYLEEHGEEQAVEKAG